MNNIELRMQLREELLSLLNREFDLAKLGTNDIGTAYTDVAYEILYAFDSLVTKSTLNYSTEKHDAITGIADYVYRYIKAEYGNEYEQ